MASIKNNVLYSLDDTPDRESEAGSSAVDIILGQVNKELKEKGDRIITKEFVEENILPPSDWVMERRLSEVIPFSTKVARALVRRGLQKSDVVQLYMSNNADLHLIVLAVWTAGGSVSMLAPDVNLPTWKAVVELTNPSFVFRTPDVTLDPEETTRLGITVVVVVGKEVNKGELTMEEFLDDDEIRDVNVHRDVSPDNLAVTLCSSGTTGKPKIIQISHRSMICHLGRDYLPGLDRPYLSALDRPYLSGHDKPYLPGLDRPYLSGLNTPYLPGLDRPYPSGHDRPYLSGLDSPFLPGLDRPYPIGLDRPGRTHLVALNMAHSYGFHFQLSEAFCNGATFVFLTDVRVHCLVNAVRRHRPSVISLRGCSAIELSRIEMPRDLDLSSVELMVLVGSALRQEIVGQLRDKFVNAEVWNCYGLTEVGWVSRSFTYENLGSLHRGVSVKIVDPDTKEVLGANRIGEILIKTDTMMQGYMGQSEDDDSNIFSSDGYFFSGDLGYYDETGQLYYKDRLKLVMKYKLDTFYPRDLETLLEKIPGVLDAAVFARPDEDLQDMTTAVVVMETGFEMSEDEIERIVNVQVASPGMRIRGGVHFVSAIPRNGMGKVAREELKELLLRE